MWWSSYCVYVSPLNFNEYTTLTSKILENTLIYWATTSTVFHIQVLRMYVYMNVYIHHCELGHFGDNCVYVLVCISECVVGICSSMGYVYFMMAMKFVWFWKRPIEVVCGKCQNNPKDDLLQKSNQNLRSYKSILMGL